MLQTRSLVPVVMQQMQLNASEIVANVIDIHLFAHAS